jgi:hypothetical protein
MILAVLGAILIIAGVAIVVRKTAETWLQRRAGRLEPAKNRRFPIMLSCLSASELCWWRSGRPAHHRPKA